MEVLRQMINPKDDTILFYVFEQNKAGEDND